MPRTSLQITLKYLRKERFYLLLLSPLRERRRVETFCDLPRNLAAADLTTTAM